MAPAWVWGARVAEFVNASCPSRGAPAKRETDILDTRDAVSVRSGTSREELFEIALGRDAVNQGLALGFPRCETLRLAR